MRRLLLLLVLIGAGEAQAQVCSTGQGFTPTAFAYESLEPEATALKLTVATFRPTTGPSAVMAWLTTDAGSEILRYRLDGPAVTDATGHQLQAGSTLIICGDALTKFSVISESGSAGALFITYFRAPGVNP